MTIKEIAHLAGVSTSTVSKIVNGKDQNINSETRERVLKIVKEYNYSPYAAIQRKNNTKTFIIALLLKNTTQNTLFINGVLNVAQQCGYNVLLFDSDSCTESELKHITSICKNNVDGLIWEPVDSSSVQHLHYLLDRNIYVNYINSDSSELSFSIDFYQLGYYLTQKLIDNKHTNIACLQKHESKRSEEVLKGFQKCLYDNQIVYHNSMSISVSDGDFFNKIISNNFSGIVSTHFASAIALYEQMNKQHYSIPSNLSLISLKDDGRESLCFPHISSVKIPYQEFGQYVCQQLIAQCEQNLINNQPFSTYPQLDNNYSISSPTLFRAKKIVVVGSINTDITFYVNHLPRAGKTTRIQNSTISVGGKGANQAVGVAKLAKEVCLIGETGNDNYSSLIFDTLEHEHVETRGIHRNMNEETGKAYIFLEKNGESTITILDGANSFLTPEVIIRHQHLFENVGYCLLSTEVSISSIMCAANITKYQQGKNILKPAAIQSIPPELYPLIDYFIPNKEEASTLCPHTDSVEKQAQYFFEKGIENVIITLGSHGCYLKNQSTEKYFPASTVVATDTTGGADSFIAALAAYLTDGCSLEKSIQIATIAAGYCVSRQGSVPALIEKQTLENHISRFSPLLLNIK